MAPLEEWPNLALMRGLIFQLDANRVNAKATLPCISELEEWRRRGVIGLEWSAPVYNELRNVDFPGRQANPSLCGSGYGKH